MKRLTYSYYLKQSNKLSPEERTKKEPVWVRISLPSFKIDGKPTSQCQYVNLGVVVKPIYFGTITSSGKGISYCKDVVNGHLIPTSDFRKKQIKFDAVMTSLFNRYEYEHPENHEIIDFIVKTFAYDPMANTRTVTSVHSFIEKHVIFLKSIKGTGRNESVSDNTLRQFPVINRLIDSYDNYTGKKLTFSNLTEERYYALWRHANDTYEKKYGAHYKPRTLSTYQGCLLRICAKAQYDGEKLGMVINHEKLKIDLTKVKLDNSKVDLHLKEDKLRDIINHRFENKTWENTRQYIILAALTGMRTQSMSWCSGQPIAKCTKHGYSYIDSEQCKTGTECFIPLPDCVKKLCINDHFPVFNYSSVTYNKTIKKILAYFNVPQSKDFSKHNLRSSLVTNLANNLLPLDKIALITHPKKIESTTAVSIYVRVEKLYRAEIFYLEAKKIVDRNKTTLFKY
ncbi:MAG: hypothetical protein ACI93P_001442 [bacterium]|jgi:hypothetical protein